MNTVNLVLGDWSDDGHGKTGTITISINLTSKELYAAYRKGCEVVGFNLTEDVAAEYEDSLISKEYLDRLIASGFKPDFHIDDDDELEKAEDEGTYISSEDFAEIWLFIAKLGDPGLQYEVVEDDSIKIGGYGLFGS